MRIALIGVGLMGYPIGVRLCEAGYDVVAYNRTREKAEQLLERGARVADTARMAVMDADIVVTMLEQGQAVNEVLFDQGAASAIPRGALVIDMSSVKPAEAQEHAAALQVLGVRHLDAPVSGGTLGAAAGTLAVMVGGDPADFADALPLLQTLGRPVHVGSHGAGQLAKLANQMIVGISIGAVAEALLFAQRGGADMACVHEAIRGGFAESRILEVHGKRMIERDFAKRAAVDVQLKDMRNAVATAEGMGCALPITKMLADLYESASVAGFGNLDHSAILLSLEGGSSV